MNKDRIIHTIQHALVFFASVHIVILFIIVLRKQDLVLLNLFNIWDLEEFFPGIDQGLVSFIVSGVIMGIVFLVSYLTTQHHEHTR